LKLEASRWRECNVLLPPPSFQRVKPIPASLNRSVQLNSTSSRKWDLPVWPSSSLREPTRYQIIDVTLGEVWTSFVRTPKPLSRTVRPTSSVANAEGISREDISYFQIKTVT